MRLKIGCNNHIPNVGSPKPNSSIVVGNAGSDGEDINDVDEDVDNDSDVGDIFVDDNNNLS